MICKKCGKEFHYYDGYCSETCMDNGYCSDNCMRQSDEYNLMLANTERLARSFTPEQKQLFSEFRKYDSDFEYILDEIINREDDGALLN